MKLEKNSKNQEHGGARKGSGRKPGAATKLTKESRAIAASLGKTPLEVMLEIMNDTDDERLKLTAAQAAAPYVHAKLSSVELKGTGENGEHLIKNIAVTFVKPDAS